MNNIDKAAKLLVPNPTWCERVHKGEGGNPCMFCEADAEAGAVRLADAGLLAPDVPEPGVFKDGSEVEWDTPDGYVNVENGLITISHDERTEDDTPEQRERLQADPGQIIITDPAEAEYLGHLIIAAARTIKGEPK